MFLSTPPVVVPLLRLCQLPLSLVHLCSRPGSPLVVACQVSSAELASCRVEAAELCHSSFVFACSSSRLVAGFSEKAFAESLSISRSFYSYIQQRHYWGKQQDA